MVMFKAHSLFVCLFGFAVEAAPTIRERVAYVPAEIASERSKIGASPNRFAELREDLLDLYIRSEELTTTNGTVGPVL